MPGTPRTSCLGMPQQHHLGRRPIGLAQAHHHNGALRLRYRHEDLFFSLSPLPFLWLMRASLRSVSMSPNQYSMPDSAIPVPLFITQQRTSNINSCGPPVLVIHLVRKIQCAYSYDGMAFLRIAIAIPWPKKHISVAHRTRHIYAQGKLDQKNNRPII